jgi:hypothetical protein
MEICRRARRFCTFVLVLGFHVFIGWLLWATPRVPSVPAPSTGLEIVLIASPARAVAAEINPTVRVPERAGSRNRNTVHPPPVPDVAPAEESNAIYPPIDWDAELARAAQGARAGVPAEPKNFGYPHHSAIPPMKTPDFGWSHAQTHRVESLPDGGVVINLNDNCVLVLNPLPFAMCSPFNKKADGDLFEHMRETPQSSDPEP